MRKRDNSIPKTTKGKGANYRSTKSGAGMTKTGVAAYRKANPGSKLNVCVPLVAIIYPILTFPPSTSLSYS